MHPRLVLLVSSAVIAAACSNPTAERPETVGERQAAPSVAIGRGGSNYDWYALAGCDRDPFGVVKNYNAQKSIIDGQLAAMRARGQQRLRVAIFHMHAPISGTLMDSTNGDLSPADRSSLANFLAGIKAAGFAEILVSYFPTGPFNVPSWPTWNEAAYQENWNVIYNTHRIIAGAGLPYHIDLMNEAIPAPGQTMLLQYTQRLWGDYNLVFGKADTVGFSAIGDPARIEQMPAVYGGNYPPVFSIHFYGSAYDHFKAVDASMARLQLGQGWVIGEGYYNDALEASDLRRAIVETGRPVWWLTQWPITETSPCSDVDVATPLDFDNYIAQGF